MELEDSCTPLEPYAKLDFTMAGRISTLRIRSLHDPEPESDLKDATPAQLLSMMWQLAVDAWTFKGEHIAESRLPRHVVRLVRRKC